MRIQIVVEAREPPAGSVLLAGAEPVPFVGWLGLLRALSEVLELGQLPGR